MMTQLQIEIETVLRYLGGGGTKKGFWGLYHGVGFAMEDPSMLCAVTKRLYPAIAQACGMKQDNVIRDMRSLVEWIWENGDREALRRIANRKLADKPSVGEFLDYVASYLRRKGY